MQFLLLPVTRSAVALLSAICNGGDSVQRLTAVTAFKDSLCCRTRPLMHHDSFRDPYSSLSPLKLLGSSYSPYVVLSDRRRKALSSSPVSAAYSPISNEPEKMKLAQVSRRLETTSRYFKRLGSFGFWGQLVCTVVAAVILSFSTVITGKITSLATFYATAAGIAAAFVSVFWSFGYIRLSNQLLRTATDPTKAPPRADVIEGLKNGIIINLLGLGAAILGYSRLTCSQSTHNVNRSLLSGNSTWEQPSSCTRCLLGSGLCKHYTVSFPRNIMHNGTTAFSYDA